MIAPLKEPPVTILEGKSWRLSEVPGVQSEYSVQRRRKFPPPGQLRQGFSCPLHSSFSSPLELHRGLRGEREFSVFIKKKKESFTLKSFAEPLGIFQKWNLLSISRNYFLSISMRHFHASLISPPLHACIQNIAPTPVYPSPDSPTDCASPVKKRYNLTPMLTATLLTTATYGSSPSTHQKSG